jgi:hypothetical protein
VNAQLLRGTLLRLVLFVVLVGISGLTFFWYWVPLRLAYGVSYSISKSKLTLLASPCRIIYTVCGSPSRHF